MAVHLIASSPLRTNCISNQLKRLPLMAACMRYTHKDQVRERIGKREIVGYGWNGSPCYLDRLDFPMPPIRFQEPNAEICQLREKERCDWKKMSLEEKKALYRYSFCQTLAEVKAPTSEWKLAIGTAIWIIAASILLCMFQYMMLYDDNSVPDTFDEPRRQAQLKRIIALHMNPIEGLASKWDYDRNRWK